MALVRMLVQTSFGGGPLYPGDTLEVEERTAKRWFKNNIAVPVIQEAQEEQGQELQDALGKEYQGQVPEEEIFEVDYSKMTAKELYILCKGKNLEVLPKQSRKYYIEKLEAAQEGQQDQGNIEEEDSEEQDNE